MTLGGNHHDPLGVDVDVARWADEPAYGGSSSWRSDRKVVHLVLLGGRLVESWSERAEGTRWEHLVTERARPVVQLPRDENQGLLDWLTTLCGSRSALDTLTVEPLRPGQDGSTDRTASSARHRDELDDLLVRVGAACFDEEAVVALRRAAALLEERRGPGAADLTLTQRASGIAWAVGKANGLLGPGLVAPGAIQHALGLTAAVTSAGRAVERALAGPLVYQSPRPSGAPDLLPLGRTDLLLGATRRAVITWRDRARAAQAAAATQHPCTLCSPD